LKGFDPAGRRVSPRVVDEQVHQMSKALGNNEDALKNHLVFARAFLAALLSRVHFKLAAAQGSVDLAITACALERHRLASGQFPETLAALTPRWLKQVPHDVTTGKPLHYERTADGQFLLYSVGWNESDDSGELAFLASGRGPEKKDGDWVWRYPTRK